jgi:hypothetical protein
MMLDLRFPEAPGYRANWSPIYFEPITGSGERITVAIVVADQEGFEVRRTIRDDVLKALYGSRRDHLSQMLEFVLDYIRSRRNFDQISESLPVTGFSFGRWQVASSRANRLGVLRQAIYRCSSLASLDDLDTEEDDTSAQETTKNWFSDVRTRVLNARPDLAPSFNKSVPLFLGGLPARLAFLHNGRGAQFETLRPNGISVSLRSARGKIYEMMNVRRVSGLDTGTLILGAPREDDITYGQKAIAAAHQGIRELTQEAEADDIAVVVAHTVPEAADFVLSIAA